MEQNNERIVQLIYRRLKGLPLSVEENSEVEEWLARSESNRRTYQNLSDEAWLKEAKKKYYAPGKEAGLAQLREQLLEEAPVTRSYRMQWLAAASVLIILTVATFYYLAPTKQDLQVAVANVKNQLEITPGGEAILTLSNGLKIPLREQADGLLANLGDGKQLLKQDGKLVYQSAIVQYTAGGVDTTTDPRSDQYSVVLPDGSRAWLNRGTTLNYPESFAADKRIVELNGEAYFEIAQVAGANGQGKLPFIVRMAGTDSLHPAEVEVLGTHFNIYAHNNVPIRTTLTEGKVKMSKGDVSQLLQPGQQAILDTGTAKHIQVTANISTEDVLAWKNYQFRFKEESIHTIMQELQRWYGNPLVIDGVIKGKFNLISDRNKPLSEVLNMLNQNGNAQFRMDGRTMVVTP